MTKPSPFCYFKTNLDIIRLAVMMCVRFPLSPRNVEDLLHERGIDVITSRETTLKGIAKPLNARGIRTARGGAWHPTTVANLKQRTAA